MAAQATKNDDVISEINIVPLVDIILVVLIIFMVTAPAMMKPSVSVQLPEASSGDQSTPSLLQVAITADGKILFNNLEVGEDDAKQMAKREFDLNPEVQAVIAADRNVSHGTVIQVLDWVKSQGVRHFAVTTDQPLGE